MRLEYIPPREMLRALTTAVAALRRAGATKPARHIMMLTAKEDNFTALLLKKTPFTETEEKRVCTWAATNTFLKVTAAPHLNTTKPSFYQTFLALDDPVQEQAYYSICPFNIAPVTDDRPFFFRYSFWRHLWPENQPMPAAVPASGDGDDHYRYRRVADARGDQLGRGRPADDQGHGHRRRGIRGDGSRRNARYARLR